MKKDADHKQVCQKSGQVYEGGNGDGSPQQQQCVRRQYGRTSVEESVLVQRMHTSHDIHDFRHDHSNKKSATATGMTRTFPELWKNTKHQVPDHACIISHHRR